VTRTLAVLAAAAAVIAAALVIATTRDGAATRSVETRVQEIAAGLRCPVCQNLSVADSPSRLAGEMRDEIEARVRAGASEDDIRTYFVERYGAWVLLEPPRQGLNLVPFLVPIAAVAAGVGIWFSLVRRRPRAVEDVA
jgi:cytochrome c-type biogenesis protein CcmH